MEWDQQGVFIIPAGNIYNVSGVYNFYYSIHIPNIYDDIIAKVQEAVLGDPVLIPDDLYTQTNGCYSDCLLPDVYCPVSTQLL